MTERELQRLLDTAKGYFDKHVETGFTGVPEYKHLEIENQMRRALLKFSVLRKAAEDWHEVCGCCACNCTTIVTDKHGKRVTEVTRVGIREALEALRKFRL